MLATNVSPYNDGVTSVFNVTQNELESLAKIRVPDVPSLPPTLPGMSLIVIQGDATFTIARPLVGSGILAVFGNLTVPAGSYWNGVIYTTGNYSQSGPSLISGAVVAHGSITLVGRRGHHGSGLGRHDRSAGAQRARKLPIQQNGVRRSVRRLA